MGKMQSFTDVTRGVDRTHTDGRASNSRQHADARATRSSMLTREQLEAIREDAMAEDVPIDMTVMASWTEEYAVTFFENGGEAEHEVTAWLRKHDLINFETQTRYAFTSLQAIKDAVAAALVDAGDGSTAKDIAAGKVLGALKMRDAGQGERAAMRKAIKVLCGLETAEPEPKPKPEPIGAEKKRPPSGAAIAHRLPGAMPLSVGKKVIVTDLQSEPALNGQVAEVMVGAEMPAITDPASGGYYTVKLMHGQGQGVTGRAQNTAATLRRVLPSQIILHPDQVEKDRIAAADGAIVLLGGDDAERAARQALYQMRLDPQHWYDQAVERILSAPHEFEVLSLTPKWTGASSMYVCRRTCMCMCMYI